MGLAVGYPHIKYQFINPKKKHITETHSDPIRVGKIQPGNSNLRLKFGMCDCVRTGGSNGSGSWFGRVLPTPTFGHPFFQINK